MLNWSIRLFRVFGIQLAVHSTFFLLLGYVAWTGWRDAPADNLAYPIYGLLLNIAVLIIFFTCVVLHELGHALTARCFGVEVPRILLLPIGGMAEFDSIPRKPSSELLIAFAGPAVNFVIVAIMVICLVPFPGEQIAVIVKSVFSPSAYENVSIDMTLQQEFLTMNLVMGCFNLVPVYPMDGGRVLRALLATRLNYLQATFYAATIAKILASIAIIAALCHERWLIAALFTFIFFAGEMEYRSIKRREREEARWRRMVAQLDIATAARRPLPNMRSGGQ